MSGLWIWLIILHVSQAFEDLKQLTILSFFNRSYDVRITKANKLFFLNTMTLEFSKYSNDQLGVFWHMKHQKSNWLKTFLKNGFFIWCNILSNTYVILGFWKFLTFPYISTSVNGEFVFPDPRPWPQICISWPQPSIFVCLFFVLRLKFVIVTVSTYINHSHKK